MKFTREHLLHFPMYSHIDRYSGKGVMIEQLSDKTKIPGTCMLCYSKEKTVTFASVTSCKKSFYIHVPCILCLITLPSFSTSEFSRNVLPLTVHCVPVPLYLERPSGPGFPGSSWQDPGPSWRSL